MSSTLTVSGISEFIAFTKAFDYAFSTQLARIQRNKDYARTERRTECEKLIAFRSATRKKELFKHRDNSPFALRKSLKQHATRITQGLARSRLQTPYDCHTDHGPAPVRIRPYYGHEFLADLEAIYVCGALLQRKEIEPVQLVPVTASRLTYRFNRQFCDAMEEVRYLAMSVTETLTQNTSDKTEPWIIAERTENALIILRKLSGFSENYG